MAADDGFVTITRIIEMHGPAAWINEVLKKSFVPINGTVAVGAKGAYMRGGVVMWSPQPTEPQVSEAIREAELDRQEAEQAEQAPVELPHRPRFEDTLKSNPNRNAPVPLRVPKPTGVK